jgi:hypothetical protein
MAFSDEELSRRLRNLAADYSLSGDAVNAKWLYEASARIMEAGHLITAWHPSLTSAPTTREGTVLEFKVKNPFKGEM